MLEKQFQQHIEVIQELKNESLNLIYQLGERAATTLLSGNTIFLCGNGGSAADSQHIAAEIVGKFEGKRKGYPAIALTTNTSILTAVSNDFGYESVFERQIEALARAGDMLIAISTSGNSINVVRAVEKSKRNGLFTVALTGKSGGILKEVVDLCIPVPSNNTARIQEAHIFIGHLMCKIIDEKVMSK